MKRTITYDQTIDIGYIYLIPPRIGTIKETIELDVNECVNVDIDKEGRVAGLELFAEEAKVLKHTPVYEDSFRYVLRIRKFSQPIIYRALNFFSRRLITKG
ncbi:DUF2283 domain-containing protein [Bacillus altitudinis]|uniref:DUF2283 domain-containing protein n=1 Tax=Bacillus altitudinis TaxID=293387 RepID=UPI001F3F073C|nr:DUF2283 domain-containing protein [Bacillus altitudinis]